MKLTLIKKSKDKLIFLIQNTTNAYVNTLRRLIIADVPTMAIEDVEFRQNDSVLYDEMIALRLGLIPLKTDLESYNLPNECSCKGAGCAKCQLKFSLSAKGPKTVYAEDLISNDPKVVPVYGKMPIVKLLPEQKLELEATAVLGKGKVHSKWSPGLASFRAVPIITSNKNTDKSIITKHKGVLELSGSKVNIIDYTKYNGAIEQDLEEAGFTIDYSDKDFIFTVESWGQLPVTKIIPIAINEFDKTLKQIHNLLSE